MYGCPKRNHRPQPLTQKFKDPVVLVTIEMRENNMPLVARFREFPWLLGDLIFPFMMEYLVCVQFLSAHFNLTNKLAYVVPNMGNGSEHFSRVDLLCRSTLL